MKIDKDKIEDYCWVAGGIFLVSIGIAFGFSMDILQFFKYLILSIIVLSGGYWWLSQKKRVDERVQTLESMLEVKRVDERVQTLESMLSESDAVIQEMEEVISHYEEMIDTALTRIPCVCGKNTFEGVFAMNVPNEVVCEKCSAKYQITLKHESILISEPIEDLNISKLIEEKS